MLSPLLGRRAAPRPAPRPTAALGSLVAAMDSPPPSLALLDPQLSFLRPGHQMGRLRGMVLWGPAHEAPQPVSLSAASSCLVVHMLGCRHSVNPGPQEKAQCTVGDALSPHGPVLLWLK